MKSPLLRYHGGKWRAADKIIPLFPPHKIYVEPFGGGASILFRKRPSKVEVYNDLDGDIVNLFRVVREHPEILAEKIDLTPYARDEWKLAFEDTEDPIERARRTLIRSYMSFGSAGVTKGSTGFRGVHGGSHSYNRWCLVPDTIRSAAKRLKKVVIENLPFEKIFERYDTEETIFYVDPPYLPSTRSSVIKGGGKYYRHEMSEEDHIRLIEILKNLKGSVILSGYSSSLYDRLLRDWHKYEFMARASGNTGTVMRNEVLWISFSLENNLFKGFLCTV